MDFMVEKSYPRMSDGSDKVFFVNANLKKHAKNILKKRCRRRIIVACTAIKNFTCKNLKLHQQTCEQNENRNEYRRYYGVDADGYNGGFKLIESA